MKFRYRLKDVVIGLIVLGVFMPMYYELLFMSLSLCLIFVYRKQRAVVSSRLLLVITLILLYSIISASFVGYPLYKTFQQCVLIIVFASLYFVVFKYLKYDLNMLFQRYLTISYVVSILGLFQFSIYLIVGFDVFSYTSSSLFLMGPKVMRVSSFLAEPANLAGLLLPSIVYFISKSEGAPYYYPTLRFIVTLLAFLLAFSNAAYLIFFIAVTIRILTLIKRKRYMGGFFIFVIVLFIVKPFVVTIDREDSLLSRTVLTAENLYTGFVDLDPRVLELLDASSYASLANLYVAVKSPLRFTGTGLGTHEFNYFSNYQSTVRLYGLNASDAYSLLVRVFSEFGVIGVLFLLLFLFKNYNRFSLINYSVLFLLLQLLVRGGHYTFYGTIFFFYLYYYTSNRFGFVNKHKCLL